MHQYFTLQGQNLTFVVNPKQTGLFADWYGRGPPSVISVWMVQLI